MEKEPGNSPSLDKSIDSLVQLPESVRLLQSIPIETMLKQGKFSKKQTANIRANVKSIRLLYNITPQKSGKVAVRSGLSDYNEIQIIALELALHGFYRYAFHQLLWPIFRAVPYPMIVIAYCTDGIEPVVRIAADACRDNKFDDSLNVVEFIKSTCWIGMNSINDAQGCNMRLLRSFGVSYGIFENLKDIYNTWLSEIVRHYTSFQADWALNQHEFTYLTAALGRYSRAMDRERELWLYPST